MKKVFCVILLIIFAYGNNVYAAEFTKPELRIVVDGELLNSAVDVKGNLIYVSAREIAPYLNKNVYWSNSHGLIVVEGRRMSSPDFYLKDSRAMVCLNYMFRNTKADIDFYKEFNVVSININSQVEQLDLYKILPSYSFYSEEDLNWMARIIHAEAKGENYSGKLAVGSVILNRMESNMFPDTVRDVIFDRQNGVQFTPTINGSIYKEPCHDSWMAALEVLEGRKNVGDAMFFMNPRTASSSWVSRNRQYALSIGNHSFYY